MRNIRVLGSLLLRAAGVLSVLFSLVVFPVQADNGSRQSVTGLFSDAEAPSEEAEQTLLADPSVLRYRFVHVDLSQLNPVLDPATLTTAVVLNFFDDTTYTAVFNQVDSTVSDGFLLYGSVEGIEGSFITIAIVGDILSGNISTPTGVYYIRYIAGDVYAVEQILTSLTPNDAPIPEAPVPTVENIQALVGDDTGEQLDIMVVYTSLARSQAGGTSAIQALIANGVAYANQAYANSGVTQRMVLVHTEEVSGYSEGTDWEAMLNNLTYTGGSYSALDNVQTLRNTYQADVVSMVIYDSAYQYCGLGWVLSRDFAPAGSYSFADYAFNVVEYRCVSERTLAHETGHNLGADHDRYQYSDLGADYGGVYSYSFGHKLFSGSTCLYYTVMSYRTGSNGTCQTSIPYFSNPNVYYNGIATGVASGSLSANNALTFNNTATTAAQWRDGPVPNTPSGLTVSRNGSNQLVLNWSASSTTYIIQYLVERLVGSTWTQIGTTTSSTLTYTDTSLTCGTSYSYRVRARNGDGYSAYTSTVTETACRVEAPSGLSALSNPSVVSVSLTWTDNSSFEEGFLVERSLAGANSWTQIASLGANVTSFVNKASIACGTAYDYRVQAYQGTYYSDYTATASATTLICAPLDPTGFTATTASQSRINLAWTDTSDDAMYQESGFTIERQVGAGGYSSLVTLAGETTTYTNSGLTCGTSYGYRIQAFNAGGTSAWVTATASTNACGTPAGPIGLAVQAVSQYEVLITWTDGDDETAYYVERSPDGSTWTQIAALAADSSEYLDNQLTPGTQYYYRVRSANSYSTAPYTYAGPLSATTFTLSLYSPLVH